MNKMNIELTKEELVIAIDLIENYLSEYGGKSEWFDLLDKMKFIAANEKVVDQFNNVFKALAKIEQKEKTGIHILYYRNVPRNVVMVKTGDYETLRKLEQEIRLRDPGNYLALHKLEPIKEEEIESIVKEVFNESTSI